MKKRLREFWDFLNKDVRDFWKPGEVAVGTAEVSAAVLGLAIAHFIIRMQTRYRKYQSWLSGNAAIVSLIGNERSQISLSKCLLVKL